MWAEGMAVKLIALLSSAVDVDIQVTITMKPIYPGKNPQHLPNRELVWLTRRYGRRKEANYSSAAGNQTTASIL
jgi:hypothetical protein